MCYSSYNRDSNYTSYYKACRYHRCNQHDAYINYIVIRRDTSDLELLPKPLTPNMPMCYKTTNNIYGYEQKGGSPQDARSAIARLYSFICMKNKKTTTSQPLKKTFLSCEFFPMFTGCKDW